MVLNIWGFIFMRFLGFYGLYFRFFGILGFQVFYFRACFSRVLVFGNIMHEGFQVFGGHFGQNKTLNMVEERFFWSLICRDVEKYAYLPVLPKCKRGFTQ